MFYKILLAIIWSQPILFSYFEAFVRKIPIIGAFSDAVIIPSLVIVLVLGASRYLLAKCSHRDLLFAGLFIFVYILSALFFPENSDFLIPNACRILFTIMPVYFVGVAFDEELIDFLDVISVLSICSFLLFGIIFGYQSSNGSYYMSQAYKVLPHLCMVVYYSLRKYSLTNMVVALIGSVVLLSFGTRGPVLIIGLFLFVFIFALGKYKHPILIKSSMIAAIIIALTQFKNILLFFRDIIVSIGMSTRVIDSFLQDTLFVSKGRNWIKDLLNDAILQHPYRGYGIGGERTFGIVYAHDYIYELLVSFGVIAGSALIIATFYLLINAFIKQQGEKQKTFFLLLICCFFVKLFMSSSYLQEPIFFFMIGHGVGILKNYKRRRLNDCLSSI